MLDVDMEVTNNIELKFVIINSQLMDIEIETAV